MIDRICTYQNCGRKALDSNRCFHHKPNKPMKRGTLKARKPMKKVGPITIKWLKTRKEWIKKHPGPWACYICGKPLETSTEMTLDHIKSRSRHPELRNDLTNLAPCCWNCNTEKGSRDLEEVKHADS